MDKFKFHDIRVEKANAISTYRRIQRLTTLWSCLFRFVELLVFLIIVSRFSVERFAFPMKALIEYSGEVSVALISPQFVFLIGNAIVIVLFLKSGKFSAANGGNIDDVYEEYVEKCRRNQERKASDAYGYGVCYEEKKMCRSNSERVKPAAERRRELTRSNTERCRKSTDPDPKAAAEAEEMSSEEFRRTVEAFIARQQRFLREE